MRRSHVQLTIAACIALAGVSCQYVADPAKVREAMRAEAIRTNTELLKIERVAIICGAPDDISDAKCKAELSYHAATGLSKRLADEGFRNVIDKTLRDAAKPVEVVRIVRVSERDQIGQIADSVDAMIYVCMEDFQLISLDPHDGAYFDIEYTHAYKSWLRKPTDAKPLVLSFETSGKTELEGLDKSSLPADKQKAIDTIASWCGRDSLSNFGSGISMIGEAGATD